MVQLPDVIRAPRTDAVYNCHSYLTKVPISGITPFIEAMTHPGELILDPFAGSGMTGIAAYSCGRNALLSDVSVLGRHVARGYLAQVDASYFRERARAVIERARTKMCDLYLTSDSLGCPKEMVRTIWSFTYLCPQCAQELVYYEFLDKRGKAPPSCPWCRHPFNRRRWQRRRDVPVRVIFRNDVGRLVEKAVENHDRERITRAERDPRQAAVPNLTIDAQREMFRRSALAKNGLEDTRNFFSARNALGLLELWRAIESEHCNSALHHKLRFAFTAILLRASRRYQWGPRRPLNAQAQTYYIAPVYYEWNIFELYERKVEAAIRSDSFVFGEERVVQVDYELASADDLSHVADESVDYVFTDPPFGSNIFYSDMSLFHEAWLGEVTDARREAVLYTTRERREEAAQRYETLLNGAFAEALRVLKPGRFLSVVFGNSKGDIWALLLRALAQAGFQEVPDHVAILDKGQRSVKGLASGSEKVVTLDLVLTFKKPRFSKVEVGRRTTNPVKATQLFRAVLTQLDSESVRNPSTLFVAMLREAIRRGCPVDTLHLSQVISAVCDAGNCIDKKSGLFVSPPNVSTTLDALKHD